MNTDAPKRNVRPDVTISSADSGATIQLSGAWNTTGLEHVDEALDRVELPKSGAILVDASGIESLDTGGALRIRELLTKLEDGDGSIEFSGLSPRYQQLLGFVWTRVEAVGVVAEPTYQTFMERIGEEVWSRSLEGASFLAFIGEPAYAGGVSSGSFKPRVFKPSQSLGCSRSFWALSSRTREGFSSNSTAQTFSLSSS